MLNQETMSIIKSTAPILAVHGETLTKHFYKRMFEHNPEVLPFFNTSNQGKGNQQKALAAAVLAYASNIDNLGALGGAVELIAQKHASLQIQPEHYPIVGENLLASIKEVLGEGATPEIISAWGEAYGILANILIGREKQIYDHNAALFGGWRGFKKLKVTSKVKESDNITSFYLSNTDGSALPAFHPGQYITLRVPSDNGLTTMRNYSLSDKAGQNWFRISVKKEEGSPAGFVSNYLHNMVNEETELEVSSPCGEFFIDLEKIKNQKKPLVFLAAGVGITPIMSMLESVSSLNHQVTLIYSTLNDKVQAFKKVIDEHVSKNSNLKVHYIYNSVSDKQMLEESNISLGLISKEILEKVITDRNSAQYYFCGPEGFMKSVHTHLNDLGVKDEMINYEFFGPKI